MLGTESGCEPGAVWTHPRSPQSWRYDRARLTCLGRLGFKYRLDTAVFLMVTLQP